MKHLKLFEAFNTESKIRRMNYLFTKFVIEKSIPNKLKEVFDSIELKYLVENNNVSFYLKNIELSEYRDNSVIQDYFDELFIFQYSEDEDLELEYREYPLICVMKINSNGKILLYWAFLKFVFECIFSDLQKLDSSVSPEDITQFYHSASNRKYSLPWLFALTGNDIEPLISSAVLDYISKVHAGNKDTIELISPTVAEEEVERIEKRLKPYSLKKLKK